MKYYHSLAFIMAFVVSLALHGLENQAYAQSGPAGGAPLPVATPSSSSSSSSIAPQTCNTDVWKTMEDRAILETEREIMQNQNLIFKPDSVLQYVCFDSFAAHAANTVGDLFTHTTYWGGKAIISKTGPNSMLDAMENVVLTSLETYLDSSFTYGANSGLLGDRGRYLGLSTPVPKTSINTGDSYSCSQMSNVWKVAKCLNFMHVDPFDKTDGFYPFKNLAAGPGSLTNVAGYETYDDVRDYPATLKCPGTPPVVANQAVTGWANLYNSSKNTADSRYAYGFINSTTFTDVRRLVEPGVCSGTVSTPSGSQTVSNAIPTGITVILGNGTSTNQPDGVCTNPGCTYLAGTCS